MRRVGVVGVGAAAGLALALPAALVAQVLDALSDDEVGAAATIPLVLLVLTGTAVAGSVASDRAADRVALGRGPAALGASAGFVVIAVVQALGVARRLVADEDVAWGTVPVVTLVAVGVATAAGIVAARRPRPRPRGRRAGRTRP